nr:hypothetical protein [uncultured Cohaesibacter sp.]
MEDRTPAQDLWRTWRTFMWRAMSLASFLPLVVAGFVIYATWFDVIVTVIVGIVGFIGFLIFLGIANACRPTDS